MYQWLIEMNGSEAMDGPGWVSEVETHRKERDVFADRSFDDYEFDYWSGLVVEEE